ncbi:MULTISPECIES: type VI secretion system baseplate subunit TssK [Pseudomonas]|uniref:Type VI secretion system baseplate subunit TssK n=1 Tax=Pseudomonas asiatica TaxID=2219225 RepID=A0A9X4D456_9PSED|nr:type VI secretion system baseplate subunit TssK [Pseudomonas asiatica]MDD2109454.1 type VI secretion system baseplate subunit TssK [Pseudomonas asiatica]WJN49501.1 type VI secretion system baseplate subunit TssK [Pseudomonas asiatica]
MKIDRPLWAHGVVLSAQQFQQQARFESWTNQSIASRVLVHPWGIQHVAFDADALQLGKLVATRLQLCLPDSTLIDTDRLDRLPGALELSRVLPGDIQTATVVLALPLEQANGNNCLFEDGRAERPVRYRQVWRDTQDLYSDEMQSISVLEHALSLRLDEDDNSDYLTCPVARLVRAGADGWEIDDSYIPPLLSFDAHAGLLLQLDNLLTQLSAKRERLMGMRRESNQRMADFAVADVTLFWLLHSLNTYQPVLADLKAHPARHPEQVYQQLVKLAGGLLTFSLDHGIEDIPAYQHEDLEAVFPPLMRTLSTLLEASLPSRVLALVLEARSANRWQVSLSDPRLLEPEGADFYLSVRCRLPAVQVQSQFPRLCKIGSPDDVDHLVNAALDGVPLKPLGHVPAAIPLRLENQYFALDLSHEKGRAMLAGGVCALYVPSVFQEVKLELFAVLRS